MHEGYQHKKVVRSFLRIVHVTLVVFVVFAFSGTVRAVEATLSPEQEAALKKAQEQKEDTLDSLKDKIKTYQKIVTLKEKEEGQLVAEAKKLDAQSSALEGNITDNERRLADLGQEIESLESRISEKEKLISLQKSLLAGLLRSYNDVRTQSGLASSFVLASSEESSLIAVGRDRLFETGVGVREALSGVLSLRDSLSREQELTTKKKVDIESVKLRLEQQNSYLESAKRKKESLAAQAAAEQNKYEAVISDLEKQRKAIEDEIEELDAARAGKIDLGSIPGFKSGVLGYPINIEKPFILMMCDKYPKPCVSQKYGKTTFTRWYTFHNGVDFADDTGTPILSAEDGKVVATGDNGKYAYGKWIAIEHKNGLTTLYGHMSKQLVSKGKSVKRGDKIGLMGSTGYSTGPHLHFSVFSNDSFEVVESKKIKNLMIPTGAHINPTKYL